ncbi:MAG TPA: N-acetyl-1-D-myo-inositol-2-amino-2-deoxy-alpha-D-glucopyranoside deacetylase [Actinomycetota bacterium]|nr:N-acetyl-1-D-myo-inositol-2-amino-2-deoxy-alpha-D-glucopyranoside deacetylase [Actinomycetota bacterium]
MNEPRSIVFVHAHPDDESLSTGGTIARYAAEGVRVCLVTCTDGDLGEIAEVDGLVPERIEPRLGEVRREELREAADALGISDVRMLGYRDSGMAGTAGNDDPAAFVNQDLDGVVRQLVQVLREVRPQVVVTYNAYGFYGHPDHIRAHQATVAAVEASADPGSLPEAGPPHEVRRLYYTAVPKSGLRELRDRVPGAEEVFSDEAIETIGAEDHEISAFVDVRAWVPQKMAALRAHRTQMGTIAPFLSMPEEVLELVLGVEFYELADRTGGSPVVSDLFEGLET